MTFEVNIPYLYAAIYAIMVVFSYVYVFLTNQEPIRNQFKVFCGWLFLIPLLAWIVCPVSLLYLFHQKVLKGKG